MYLTQSLHRSLQQNPDRPATIYRDRVRTVAESVDRIAHLAGALAALGVQSRDRVGIVALNSDRYHEYLYAVAAKSFAASVRIASRPRGLRV